MISQERGQVGAVVLTWRDVELTMRCLRQLLASDVIGRVVVVVNEAPVGDSRWFRVDPRVEVVELRENRGFAAGVNVGIHKLLSEPTISYVLAVNNDAVLTPDNLDTLLGIIRTDPSLDLVAPISRDREQRVLANGGKINRWTWRIDEVAGRDDIDFVTWACILARKDLFDAIGLLDERFFMYWEDVDFGIRMRNSGHRFRSVPEAAVLHDVSSSHGEAGWRIQTYVTASFRYFLRKHGRFARFTGYARIAAKMAASAARRDALSCRAIRVGWSLGLRPPDPIYPAALLATAAEEARQRDLEVRGAHKQHARISDRARH